jgi:hypothetical protein
MENCQAAGSSVYFISARNLATKVAHHVILNDYYQRMGITYLNDEVLIPGSDKKVAFKGLSSEVESQLQYRYTGERNQVITEGQASGWYGDIEVPRRSEEFREQLASLKRQGRLPASVAMDGDSVAIWGWPFGLLQQGIDWAIGANTRHSANIIDFDEATGEATLSTHWGWTTKAHYRNVFRSLRAD